MGDFFKELLNLIPKLVYLLYTAFISLIDLLQLLFRKLAGLDVYYVDGVAVGGDLVTNFIQGILGIGSRYGSSSDFADRTDYSALSTVFWAFVIFGLVVCFVSTLIAIFKSHYTYNEKSAKGPMPIVASAGKAVLNMVAVPLIVVLGLWLSQAILTALDSFTSTTSDSIVSIFGTDAEGNSNAEQLLEPVEYRQNGVTYQTYLYYDMFGYTANIWYADALSWVGDRIEDVLEVVTAYQPTEEDMARVAARTQTFSGSIFKVAAYNANRVRSGEYVTSDNYVNSNITGFGGGGLTLFTDYTSTEEAANMVDTSFANFLHLQNTYEVSYNTLPRERYLLNFTTDTVSSFSKFNVGLVWYYYDLWDFNFIVGFGAAIVCIVLFFNIILGLMVRFFMCLVLFFVMPPLAGLAPLDNGKAFGTWRETFMKQVLMAYGAVVGMNLVLILLPFVNEIDFFNIEIADLVVQTLFIIVGLITIKSAISTLSGLIGAEDANATGDKINKEVGAVAGKALDMTVGAAKVAGKAFMKATPLGIGLQAAGFGLGKAGGAIGKKIQDNLDEDVVNSVKNFAGGTKAFLKGGFGGLDAYRTRRKAEQGRATDQASLDRAENEIAQGSKADLLNKLDGNSYSNDDVRNMAHAAGISDAETEAMVRNIRRDRSGNIVASTSARALAASGEDAAFRNFYTSNSGRMSNMLVSYSAAGTRAGTLKHNIQNYDEIIENQSDRLARAYKRGTTGAGVFTAGADVAKQFMANFKTGVTQGDGMNEFVKSATKTINDAVGYKPPPKTAEDKTAANTAALGEKMDALTKSVSDLANEMRRDRH